MKKNNVNFLQILTRNWGLKLISFIFAIALWLVVANVNDPTIRYTWTNVPVTIENADIIAEQGMVYEVLEGTDVVPRVTIQAPESVIQNIDKSDIVAVADMTKLSSLNTVSIELSVSRYGSQISSIRGNVDTMKVNIEDKQTISLALQTSVVGDAPEGYMVGNVSTDQNLIRVSGPESLVKQIKTAMVGVDMSTLSGFTNDITTSALIHLYDEDGNEVSGKNLEKRPENVMVTIEILAKKSVPVNYSIDTEPAEGYALTGTVTSSVEYVEIAGRKNVLNKIGEILIPASELNVAGCTEDYQTTVNLKDYLPENTRLANVDFNGRTSVVVGIEKEITSEYELDSSRVNVINLPDGLECELAPEEETYRLSITGIRSVVSGITTRSLQATMDIQKWMNEQEIDQLEPGRYTVPLSFNNPEHTRLDEQVLMNIIITEAQ